MFSRILYSTLAAAALSTATPALASETPKDADAQRPRACDCTAMHGHMGHEHAVGARTGAAAKQESTKRTAPAAVSAGEEDALSRTQSYWTAP